MTDAPDLFAAPTVTRSRAPADVDAELDARLQLLFEDTRIPKRSRVGARCLYERIKEPTQEDTLRLIAWLENIRRRHAQLQGALQTER